MVRGEMQNIASAVGWYRLLSRNEIFAKEETQRNVWGTVFRQALYRERNSVTDGCMVETGIATQGKKKSLGHIGGTVYPSGVIFNEEC